MNCPGCLNSRNIGNVTCFVSVCWFKTVLIIVGLQFSVIFGSTSSGAIKDVEAPVSIRNFSSLFIGELIFM